MHTPSPIAQEIGLILSRLAHDEELKDPGGEFVALVEPTEEVMIRSIENEKGEVIADVYGETDSEVDARLALFGTAPEIFLALWKFHDETKGVHGPYRDDFQETCGTCRLLAKAEGRQ